MAGFITVREIGTGAPMRLNSDYIVGYRATDDGTSIFMAVGTPLEVQESPEEIDALLHEVGAAGATGTSPG